jgi:hypothetical protein
MIPNHSRPAHLCLLGLLLLKDARVQAARGRSAAKFNPGW